MVDAELVQDGGPKVIHGADIGDGAVAEFVGGSVGDAAFDASASEPEAETERVVVATVAALRERCASEFPGENDQGILQHPAVLEVADERGDGAVDLFAHGSVAFFQIAVLVPRVGGTASADVHGAA